MLSTRNSQQQNKQQQQQQQQQGRNAKLMEPEKVKQLPKQSIQILNNNHPVQSIHPIQRPMQSVQATISPIQYKIQPTTQSPFQRTFPNQTPSQPIHLAYPQRPFKDVPILPSQLINEHLQTAQSQNSYQHQYPIENQPTLHDLVNVVGKPSRRRRRKSRRQRKVRNHLEESVNYWPDRLVSKNAYSTKPVTNIGPFGRANNIDAFAISLSDDKNKISLNNTKNSTKKAANNWNPIKAENVLEAPFATSTSAGKTQMIIISSSRTISTSTDRTGNASKQQNTKHRKETLKQRPTQMQTHSNTSKFDQDLWQNKYNIDYDNKLEDEYEIIMKDE